METFLLGIRFKAGKLFKKISTSNCRFPVCELKDLSHAKPYCPHCGNLPTENGYQLDSSVKDGKIDISMDGNNPALLDFSIGIDPDDFSDEDSESVDVFVGYLLKRLNGSYDWSSWVEFEASGIEEKILEVKGAVEKSRYGWMRELPVRLYFIEDYRDE